MLIQFEDDLLRMVNELKFPKVKSDFQKMYEDMKKVTSKKTLTPADKTSIMYRLNKNDYQNLLKNTMKKQIKTLEQKLTKKYQVSQAGRCIRQYWNEWHR